MTYSDPAGVLPEDRQRDVSRSVAEMAAIADELVTLAARGGPQAGPDVVRDRFRVLARAIGHAVGSLSAADETVDAPPPRDYTAGHAIRAAATPPAWEPSRWSALAGYVGQLSHAIEATRNMLQRARPPGTARAALDLVEGMMQAYEVLTLAEEAALQPGEPKFREVPREFAAGLAAGTRRDAGSPPDACRFAQRDAGCGRRA